MAAQAQWATWDTHRLFRRRPRWHPALVLQEVESRVRERPPGAGRTSDLPIITAVDAPRAGTKGVLLVQTGREIFFAPYSNGRGRLRTRTGQFAWFIRRGTDMLNVRIAHISFERDRPRPPMPSSRQTKLCGMCWEHPRCEALRTRWDLDGSADCLPGIRTRSFPPGWPHIAGDVSNVTVAQALDYILKTFPGIWWYQNCPATDGQPRTVHFGFYRLQRVLGGNFVR